ncbi:phosphoglucomutase/phosphomannomutase PgmG [Micavibrio aeruginosavorus]|uniref:phosphoglucomutase/phosphomannomutase PgmG n=1 Tax=Micavibrio aeruginosavorus TaxID=349221 RepID=UPI003F4A8768
MTTANTAKKTEMTQAAFNFDQEILREYDIRGQVGKNLSEDVAYAVGLSYGTYVRRKGGKTVALGFDGRASSPVLSAAVVRGLMAVGLDVTDIGLGPTPMLYYAVKHLKTDAGIMITGSHNPSDYNGFKMTLQTGPVYGPAVQEIGRIARAGDYETGEGSVKTFDIQDIYVDRLMADLKQTDTPLNVVWDCGNGAAGEITRRLTKKLPGKHVLLFDEIDGTFPNHHPDPTVDHNLEDLIKCVKDNGFDLGIAFDGDADRIGAVDEKGGILRCDSLITIYARDVLKRHPGATIVGDVKCSQVMYDEIARLGGKPVMWKTGHSLIKAKMAEEKSPLSGELSGHIFFGDGWYGFDDGLYCGIRLMNAVIDAAAPASTLTAHLPQIFNTPEIRFEVDEVKKFDLVASVVASVKAQAQKDPSITVNDIDGARVNTKDGWWLLRASNTQNVLVTRAEAQSADALERLKDMVRTEVGKIGYDVSFA